MTRDHLKRTAIMTGMTYEQASKGKWEKTKEMKPFAPFFSHKRRYFINGKNKRICSSL